MKLKDKINYIMLASLLLIPNIVFADSIDLSILMAIGMEAFVSIHMSVFVFKPLSEIISQNNSKKIFRILFAIRACVLLFFDLFISPSICMFDFIAVFVGAFTVMPIYAIVSTKRNKKLQQITSTAANKANVELKCTKCGSVINVTDKFCTSCGAAIEGNNIAVSKGQIPPKKVAMLPTQFDKMYNLPEEKMVEAFINKELKKANISINTTLLPSELLKRKKILNVIFSILIFVFTSMIFFHFPALTYVIGLIILFIFYKVTRNLSLIKYLKKQIKSRPEEKISNIILSEKNTFTEDNSKKILIVTSIIALIIPLIIFSSPRILYEKTDGGYAVRYYTWGLTNFKTATIPEEYKNEKVVSLRGNAFSNMFDLKSVTLPDTITEIRGQAFKNCYSLEEINIPKNLEYLGGGAFYNARSLKSIELPDTLTFLGGESFYGASSLKSIKLSENLTEIRGNTFEECTSLESIAIPDNVTRIGGHAFYNDYSLKEVTFTENSKLQEIGSSAFRLCDELEHITIPEGVSIDERAFKESPTSVSYFGNEDYDYYYYNND